jgi:aldehyde:ferredoxin oxidoreductase
MPPGYCGELLRVDLTGRDISPFALDVSLAKLYIGGSAVAARIAYDLMDSATDPLGPENPLIFMTGPLTGTIAPCSGRHAVCARSPLTGIWGEATAGGFWGATLKYSGFDGIIITGRSEKPVYIEIEDGNATIEDAGHLWGKGVYETQEIIRKGRPKCRVACIGPAGENMVRFAAIMNDGGRTAGRTGLGAVMGSKRLKAISVEGGLRPVPAREEEFREYANSLRDELSESAVTSAMGGYGTAIYTEMGMDLGDVPAKYFTENEFPAGQMTGMALNERFQVKRKACFSCPIACGRRVTMNGREIEGPEYETIAALGAMNGIYDLQNIVEANHLCNDLGMDSMSAGVTISFVTYLSEKGLLKSDMAENGLRWGDGGRLLELLEITSKREGLGSLLAEGVSRVAEKLGVDKDLAATVKGLEIPMHDPRAFYSMSIVYATGPRGACHNRSNFLEVDRGMFEDEDLGIVSGDRFTLLGKGEQIARHQNFLEVMNAAILCIFPYYKAKQVSLLLSSVTGWGITPAMINEIGERSFNLKRVMNNRFGIGRKDDCLPGIVLTPLGSGSTAGKTPKGEFEQALREYYDARGWGWETGMPGSLSGLGIEGVT